MLPSGSFMVHIKFIHFEILEEIDRTAMTAKCLTSKHYRLDTYSKTIHSLFYLYNSLAKKGFSLQTIYLICND